MPDWKQVNLYQNGFLSEIGSVEQAGEGNLIPPQTGTVFCVNTLVPHTGKAVYGL